MKLDYTLTVQAIGYYIADHEYWMTGLDQSDLEGTLALELLGYDSWEQYFTEGSEVDNDILLSAIPEAAAAFIEYQKEA